MDPKYVEILSHLTEVVEIGLKQVPYVGMAIEYKERRDLAQKLQEFFNFNNNVEQRLQLLEGLAAIPTPEVEAVCKSRLQGSEEQKKFTLEVVKQITQRVTRKMTSSKNLGTPNLTDDEGFYLNLVPERRPNDYTGQEVPYRPRWILQELIGSGGMGEVWRAKHATLPEFEAIKFCHDEAQRAFLQREVNTLKRVQELPQHPNIVRLKDVNLDHAPYWLAFEYVQGGTLQDLMQQRHLAWGEVLQLIREIATGVAAAHAIGIVHRDLKPANILLTIDGVPKVTDFGLGKILEQSGTIFSIGMGTQDYASPEQAKGARADMADDVYALGVILGHLSTYSSQAPQYLLQSLTTSRLPPAAQTLIRDCLAPREQRPANAGVFLQRLQQLPLNLAADAELKHLHQVAEEARNQAQREQNAQFAAQLRAQEQKAEQARKQQAERLRETPLPTSDTAALTGKLPEQWQQLQKVAAQPVEILATFAKERDNEQKRIDQLLQQALKDLGEFRSEPRDEEFEYQAEYETRLAQEQATYTAQRQAIIDLWDRTKKSSIAQIDVAEKAALDDCQRILNSLQTLRHPVQLTNLTDWSYNLDQGVLRCQCVLKEIFPLEQLHFTITAKATRDQARHYRTNPERFQLHCQLAFQTTPPAIIAVDVYLELIGEARFPGQADVILEPDLEAIAMLERRKQEKLAAEKRKRQEELAATERKRQEKLAATERKRQEEAAAERELLPFKVILFAIFMVIVGAIGGAIVGAIGGAIGGIGSAIGGAIGGAIVMAIFTIFGAILVVKV